MSNYREGWKTLRIALSVRVISSSRSFGCASHAFFFFALPVVLASEVGYTGKTIDRRRLTLHSLIFHVPTTLPTGFLWTRFFCQVVTDHCTLEESADSLLLFVVITPHHRCSVANMVLGSLAFVGRMLTILEFWLAAQPALTFISHVSLKVYRKSQSQCHIPWPEEG